MASLVNSLETYELAFGCLMFHINLRQPRTIPAPITMATIGNSCTENSGIAAIPSMVFEALLKANKLFRIVPPCNIKFRTLHKMKEVFMSAI